MTAAVRHRWWIGGTGAFLALSLTVLILMAVMGGVGRTAPDEGSVEAGFARDMAIHHQQAVELSFIVRDRTDDEEVRRLAFDVINTQANQRGMLLGWLEMWGLPKISQEPPMAWMGHTVHHEAHDGSLMPGMATNTQLDYLRKAEGKKAEVLYLRLLSEHHRTGVDMARAAADVAESEVVARLAAAMVQGQESEMSLMADMLKDRGV
jgi:uncharacterized protein (DUF305 family)